jgi:hypothetical protein
MSHFIPIFLLINAGFFLQNTSLLSPAAVPPQVGEPLLFASTVRGTRKMENLSRGPTFGVLVTIRTEASMQDVTRVQTPLPSLF